MSHADAVSSRRPNPVRYKSLRSELDNAVMNVACDGMSIESIRDKTPMSHGRTSHESDRMMEAVDAYVTLSLMATNPLLDVADDLTTAKQTLAKSLAAAVSTRNIAYRDEKAERFGNELAATISERVELIMANHGVSRQEPALEGRSSHLQRFIERGSEVGSRDF